MRQHLDNFSLQFHIHIFSNTILLHSVIETTNFPPKNNIIASILRFSYSLQDNCRSLYQNLSAKQQTESTFVLKQQKCVVASTFCCFKDFGDSVVACSNSTLIKSVITNSFSISKHYTTMVGHQCALIFRLCWVSAFFASAKKSFFGDSSTDNFTSRWKCSKKCNSGKFTYR